MSKGATSQNEVASNSDATDTRGGSSSPAPTHISAGGRSYRRGRGNKGGASDFACSCVQLAHGRRVRVAGGIVEAVDGFPVPAVFWREGAREAS